LSYLSLTCYVLSMVRGRKNPSYYGLPERLRRARRRQELGMSAAAHFVGKSTSSAFAIERRLALPRINTIEQYAMALGVSPSWLAYGEGPEDAVQEEPTACGLGQRLVEARKTKGLSRQALGNAAGLTGQTVANIEVHGMMPRVDTVEMLARVLGVTAGWLAFKHREVEARLFDASYSPL
jgi:transcriptional regulator with XRE-family HTH domain